MAIDLDAADILAEYLPVDLLKNEQGVRVITDGMINAQIRDAAVLAERILDVRLAPTRYASAPHIVRTGEVALVKGVDYDAVTGRHTWFRDGTHQYSLGKSLQLAHPNVISIQRVRGIMGETVVYPEIPTRWATLKRRIGVIEWVVDSGMNIESAEAMLAFFTWLGAQSYGNGTNIPNFFAVDYTAGWDPGAMGDLPIDDIKAWIAWNAVANVAAIADQLLNREGVTNQSASVDGVSRSYGVDVGKPGGRFARMLSAPSIARYLGKEGTDWLITVVKPMIHPLRLL